MAKGGELAVLTYNHIDGACAAAMALLKHPGANVIVSSAARSASRLDALSKAKKRPAKLLVCGLGIYNDCDLAVKAGKALIKAGTTIEWCCGRGYLDNELEYFKSFCTPVFLKARTNTGAVCQHLSLDSHSRAAFLKELAEHDPYVDQADHHPTGDEQFWLDRIMGAISEYLKYLDEDAYTAAIRKLAKGVRDENDERAVKLFRKSGMRYVLTGKSPSMRALRQTIKRIGCADEPVMITGESGVGKEHVAHLIHEGSDRGMNCFLAINCAMFAGNAGLANSMLFGHLKGAFTGAIAERKGAFVEADKGILYLDEFGELPPEVQAKLLRVLEDGDVTPEGADSPKTRVDVRVIVSTNRDLPEMIRRGEFRADLYHRLSILCIDVPPLRERMKDVQPIIDATCAAMAEEGVKCYPTQNDYKAIYAYDWPGNVRQLIKLLKRAALMGRTMAEAIEEERRLGDLCASQSTAEDSTKLLPTSKESVRPLADVIHEYATQARTIYGGNIAATARALDIAENTLRKYLKPD